MVGQKFSSKRDKIGHFVHMALSARFVGAKTFLITEPEHIKGESFFMNHLPIDLCSVPSFSIKISSSEAAFTWRVCSGSVVELISKSAR